MSDRLPVEAMNLPPTVMNLQAAWLGGDAAARAGFPMTANPHPPDSRLEMYWGCGWACARLEFIGKAVDR